MNKLKIFILSVFALSIASCKPDRDTEFSLDATPLSPEFSMEAVPGDGNRWIIRDITAGVNQRVWDIPGGNPKSSTESFDTIYYSKAGEYTITLYTSYADGSGTSSASKKVTILQDGIPDCSGKMALLTGDCEAPGKGWSLSHAAGAVKVGPTYDDYSWYTSPEEGLQPAQYDDRFWFTFDGQLYENRNNGASVNPWNGYAAEAYSPGVVEFTFSEGTGISGRDQIILPDDQFIGVWDADNVLDIVKLTSTELVVRARRRDATGVPTSEGWFELYFVAQ